MIPWGHNITIIQKTDSVKEALFYVNKTIKNGWSRNIFELQMKNNLYRREGMVIHNFDKKLPKVQSDLAVETLKDRIILT